MARLKLRCIMGCHGLKSNYLEKGLYFIQCVSQSLVHFEIKTKEPFSLV